MRKGTFVRHISLSRSHPTQRIAYRKTDSIYTRPPVLTAVDYTNSNEQRPATAVAEGSETDRLQADDCEMKSRRPGMGGKVGNRAPTLETVANVLLNALPEKALHTSMQFSSSFVSQPHLRGGYSANMCNKVQ